LIADGVHPAAEGQDTLALILHRALTTPPPVSIHHSKSIRPSPLNIFKNDEFLDRRLDGRIQKLD
jgi:hypothetical protein